MELTLNAPSFLDEITKIRGAKKDDYKTFSSGFRYLHDIISNKLVKDEEVNLKDFDYSKFTYSDLESYIEYYESHIQPKVNKLSQLFEIISESCTVFSAKRTFY